MFLLDSVVHAAQFTFPLLSFTLPLAWPAPASFFRLSPLGPSSRSLLEPPLGQVALLCAQKQAWLPVLTMCVYVLSH